MSIQWVMLHKFEFVIQQGIHLEPMGQDGNAMNGGIIMSQNFPTTGFVRLPQILAVFPVSPSTWWRGVKSGEYPQPVKLSGRTTAWRVEQILELIEHFSSGQDARGPRKEEGNRTQSPN
ncbi:MAG: AlpA family phage regulatory protein [Pseudomonadota bacterium]